MTISTELAQRMREAAKKATPGPWGITRNGMTVTSNQSHPIATLSEASHRMLSDGSTGQDAEFITLANPANVLALLDRIAELEELATDYGMKFQRAQDTLKYVSLMHRGEARTEQQPVLSADGREQFEEWVKFHHGDDLLRRANRGANYQDSNIDLAWIAWKASQEVTPAPAPVTVKLPVTWHVDGGDCEPDIEVVSVRHMVNALAAAGIKIAEGE